MDVCPNCGGKIAIRNPTGNCDHLYWPEYLTPEAKAKLADDDRRAPREEWPSIMDGAETPFADNH